MTDLKILQDWMQTTLMSRGNLEEKLALSKEKTGLILEEMIYSKKNVTAYECFDIYASGYVLRLLECLRADFPKLQFFLGEELFDTFAKAYIVTLPSSSWNLYYLGKNFPQFLKETQPSEANDLFNIPTQIAKIERMISESLQAKGIENTLDTKYETLGTSIQQVASLRLIIQDYDLKDFFLHIQALQHCTIPLKNKSYIAVARKNYKVNIYKLEEWQYTFLETCKEPINLNNAIKKSILLNKTSSPLLEKRLLRWIPLAIEQAFIRYT